MAGEEQYINPIIQAMAGLRQRQQNAAQLQLETQRLKQEGAHQAAQLSLLQKAHEDEHALAERKFEEVDLPLLKAHMANEKFQQGSNLINLVRNGAGPQLLQAVGAKVNQPNMGSNIAAEGPPPGVPQGVDTSTEPSVEFNGAQIPMSAITNAPQQEADLIRSRATAQTQGQHEGAYPYEQAAAEAGQARAKDLAKFQNDLHMDLNKQTQSAEDARLEKQLQSHFDVSKMERNTQLQIAGMHNATEKMIAGFGEDPGSSSRINSRMMMIGLGLTKPNGKAIDQAAQANLIAQGWRPQIEPTDIAELKGLSAMTPLLDRLQNFANTRSTNPIGAYVQGLTAEHSPIETTAQNDLAMIKADIMKVGTALEGQKGRVLAKQFGIEADSLTDPHITQPQATQRVMKLRDALEQLKDSATAGMSQTQKDAVLKYHQVSLPRYANTNPQNPSQGHRIVNYGGPNMYDAQTGKVVTASPQAVPAGPGFSAPPPPQPQQ